MSKILEAIDALAHNATHPKFMTEALHEIKGELDAIKLRIEGMDDIKAHAQAAGDAAGAAERAAQSASVAANQAALDAKTATETRPAIVALTLAPAAEVVDPVAPVVPAAPVVPPVTA